MSLLDYRSAALSGGLACDSPRRSTIAAVPDGARTVLPDMRAHQVGAQLRLCIVHGAPQDAAAVSSSLALTIHSALLYFATR